VKALSRQRYEALAGYSRTPLSLLTGIEHEWYSEQNEKVLGVIVQDRADEDFVCIISGRDRVGRYRAVWLSDFFENIEDAQAAMPDLLRDWAAKDPAEYEQADEPARAMDFFRPRHPPERLHPTFVSIVNLEAYSPAKGIMEAMMYYFEDPDGNFVEQFQSTAFDARFWELYLFAVLAECRYAVDRTHPAPDYLCRGIPGEFFMEAVTVNPTIINGQNVETGKPADPRQMEEYMYHHLPIKFAGPLTSKLGQRYWEQAHIGGRPIVLAIADCHYKNSMTWSQTGLVTYLYGHIFRHHFEDGKLVVRAEPIAEHIKGQKRIPSGFFYLPDSEHISAVVSSREGTVSKFSRIGLKAGFGSRRVRMVRTGKRYVHDPNRAEPEEFTILVNDPSYQEDWSEGLEVYHNPNARLPFDPYLLPLATHHFFENGQLRSLIPENAPFGSMTIIGIDDEHLDADAGDHVEPLHSG
jgi:hypothetical protein